jgi:hypothetical protein
MLANMGENSLSLTSLQVDQGYILLPDVAVAEVVGWQANPGITFSWREQTLACIDLTAGKKTVCIVVFNAISRHDSHFYAMAVQNLPKMLRVAEGELDDEDAKLVYPWQRGWIVVNTNDTNTQRYILPDIEQLEHALP